MTAHLIIREKVTIYADVEPTDHIDLREAEKTDDGIAGKYSPTGHGWVEAFIPSNNILFATFD
jgi:hypothetical protein